MDKTKVQIDGYDFYFDSALLARFAYVMGEPVADVGSLRYEILTFADTIPVAVERYGIEKLVKMVEERLRIQVKGA